MSEAKREDLLRRIKGLQAKTVENGCTEDEAMSAATMAAKLIDQYGFSQSDFELRDTTLFEAVWESKNIALRGVLYTMGAVNDFCDTKSFHTLMDIKGKRRKFVVTLGHEPDVALCHYLLDLITSAFEYEWTRYYKSRVDPEAMRRDLAAKRGFDIGFSNRIAQRLRAMKEARNAELDPNTGRTGTDLVVIKTSKVDDEFNRRNPNLVFKTSKPTKKVDSFRAGHAAGDRVALNTGINHDKQPDRQPIK